MRRVCLIVLMACLLVACGRPAPVPGPAPAAIPEPAPAAVPEPAPAAAAEPPPPAPTPTVWRAGIWLDTTWLQAGISGDKVRDLSSRGITDLYVRTGPYKKDGTFVLPPRSAVEALRRLADDRGLRLWAWLPGWRPTLDLDQERVVTNAAAAAAQLAATGFHGIQLDIEPVHAGDQGYLSLLDALVRQVPAGTLTGAACHLIGPQPPEAEWTPDYYAQVARRLDQVAIMAYDTYAADAAAFRKIVAYQTVTALTRAPRSTEVLIGVPAYEDRTVKRTPETEPMSAGLGGVADGFRQLDLAGRTTGWAIFAGYTMDDAEWSLWSKRPR